MATSSKIVLILGAGARVGQSVAEAFAAQGYKVASTSRTAKDSSPDNLHIAADLADPASVAGVFTKVKESLGVPSVVVYNAAKAHMKDPKNPLELTVSELTTSLNVNTLSPYAALREAVQGFAELPPSASQTFIYTGNTLNSTVMPALLDLGAGKSATAHAVQAAAVAYADKGYKFYYADERKADGSPPFNGIDGEAHGTHYVELSKGEKQGEWLQTFVKGVGYRKF